MASPAANIPGRQNPSATEGSAQNVVSTLPTPVNNFQGPDVLQPFASEATEPATQTGAGGIQTSTPGPGAAVNTQKTEASPARPTTSTAQAVPTVASGSTSSSNGGSNLSNGAVAGVAIAALIVGALIAFAAAFFFFKRRTTKSLNANSSYNTYTDSTPELVMLQQAKSAGRNSPYVQVSQSPVPAAPQALPARSSQQYQPQQQQPDILASILPAAAPPSEVRDRIAGLFNQLDRHVETYYRNVSASITPSMEPDLARFGASSSINMATLLQETSSPKTALKHALAAYVLGITRPENSEREGDTLFPHGILTSTNGNGNSDKNVALAASIHRRLSVYLHTSTSPSSPSPAIREAAEHFSLTFFPWANPLADDQEKEDELTRIIHDALEMRIWLVGQPGVYAFVWEGVGSRGIVVRPEVVRTEDGGRDREVVLEGRVENL